LRAAPIHIVAVLVTLWTALGPAAASPELPSRALSLEDCVAIALRENPQVSSSRQGIVSGEAGLTRARSSYYPRLSLSATEGLTSPARGGGSDTRHDVGLALGVTVWQRGRGESVAVSEASLRATQHNHASTIQGLVQQVAQDYYAVLAARELVKVAQAGVESSQAHLQQVKARAALGAAAEVDVFPAEDDLARAQLDLIDARSNAQLALARLSNSMGIPQDTKLEVAAAAPAEKEEIPLFQQAMQTAFVNRPELLAARASVAATRHSLNLAHIQRGPLLDITGLYVQEYADWAALGPSWDLLLGLSWPLFDGYATKADETAARARRKQPEAELQRLIDQVGLEVQQALVEVGRTSERVQASAKSVAAAQARLAAAEGRYQQGVGILLEVIDARVSLTNALATQVQARYGYQTALVGLQRSLGALPVPTAQAREGEQPRP